MDEGVVHLHLEQRAVQRLLGRFIAQGFVYHDLSRACLAQTSDAIPRVILLGRLCLYGPGAARLHEQLVPVTARWTDPKVRKGLLNPYARQAESKTLDLLEEAILLKTGGAVTGVVLNQLQTSAPRDVQELLPHLTARGEEFARDAEKKLRERGQAEAKAMREILETQKNHILATVAKHEREDTRQRLLGFAEDELRQLEANKRYWATRLTSLESELETGPDRIRGVYQVKPVSTGNAEEDQGLCVSEGERFQACEGRPRRPRTVAAGQSDGAGQFSRKGNRLGLGESHCPCDE